MTGQGDDRRLTTVTDWRCYLENLVSAVVANAGKPERLASLVNTAALRVVAENQQAWYEGSEQVVPHVMQERRQQLLRLGLLDDGK